MRCKVSRLIFCMCLGLFLIGVGSHLTGCGLGACTAEPCNASSLTVELELKPLHRKDLALYELVFRGDGATQRCVLDVARSGCTVLHSIESKNGTFLIKAGMLPQLQHIALEKQGKVILEVASSAIAFSSTSRGFLCGVCNSGVVRVVEP